VSGRLPEAAEPNELARLLVAKRAAGRSLLDLTIPNPPAAGLVALDEIARAALSDPAAALYDPVPCGLHSAREAVAATYASSGLDVDPGRLYLTASTSEAYAHLFRLLCDPGDEVLIPRPSYPLLGPIARLEDVTALPYRLTYQGRWALDVDSLDGAAGERTRAIVVIEPNNPTGSMLSAEERAAIEEFAVRRGLAVIADEVFREFPWPPGATPLPTWLGERRAPTFVLGGVSKSCGLPQAKVAWIALAGPAAATARLATGLEWILDLFLSVGAPVQVALPLLLSRRAVFQAAARERMATSLDRWREWAARGGAEVLHANGGWSVMLRLPSWDDPDREPAAWALREYDVVVHPAHFYDGDDDRCIVAGLLTPPDVLGEALERLKFGTLPRRSG
jgi:aspartate/methionine/tyrosine aminotransferase